MLLYDLGHGFPQTLKFLAWIGYKILLLFGYPPINPPLDDASYKSVLAFLGDSYRKLVYLPSSLVAFTLALFSFSFLVKTLNNQYQRRKLQVEFILVTLITAISIIGIIVTKTASEAYLPILFPFTILILVLFFESLLKRQSRMMPVIILILVLMALSNAGGLIHENYFINRRVQYSDMLTVTKTIVSEANGKGYNLIGKGVGSEHESYLMKYEYLAWREGNSPSKTPQNLQFSIEETPMGIIVEKQIKKL